MKTSLHYFPNTANIFVAELAIAVLAITGLSFGVALQVLVCGGCEALAQTRTQSNPQIHKEFKSPDRGKPQRTEGSGTRYKNDTFDRFFPII